MPRGKGIYDDEKADDSKARTDQGGHDGATTQENTPDVAETDEEPTA
jgi:hypothetical protein